MHCAKNREFVLLHSDLSFLTYEFGLESLLVKVKWISRSQSWEGSIPNLQRPILIRARALELFHGFWRLSASLFPELLFAQQRHDDPVLSVTEWNAEIHRLLLATSLVYATRFFYWAPAFSEDISSAVLLEVRKSINVDCLVLFERQLRFEFELNLSSGHASRLHMQAWSQWS